MVYKPNFCCNCGEKIGRAEWKILTSRRFCEVCAVEQKGHEYFVRSLIVGSLLIGTFGFGSYLRSPDPPRLVVAGDTAGRPAAPSVTALKPQPAAKDHDRGGRPPAEHVDPQAFPQPAPERAGASKEQLRAQGFASDEAVFYCGAMTKKGKPCSRRVKSKGRCWQHAGQPPALAPPAATDIY